MQHRLLQHGNKYTANFVRLHLEQRPLSVVVGALDQSFRRRYTPIQHRLPQRGNKCTVNFILLHLEQRPLPVVVGAQDQMYLRLSTFHRLPRGSKPKQPLVPHQVDGTVSSYSGQTF